MLGCQTLLGQKNRYHYIKLLGKKLAAHRLVWIRANGPIPEGLCILHKCDNTKCVNIDHLFLGTQQDNIRDMHQKGRYINGQARKLLKRDACHKGHAYTLENTYMSGTIRVCRKCHAICAKKRRQEKRQ